MFATAGWPAWWLPVTQSMPAMTPESVPLPWQFEHPDGDQADALGHAVGRAADRAGDVGAVAVAVVGAAAVVDRVEAADARGRRTGCG